MFLSISPRIDLAFKKIFGVEENKDLLISLINSIISKEDRIVDLQLLNPYNVRNFKSDKLSILDIKAKGNHGKLFNIEIQITDTADYDKRALYYWAKLYTEQLSEGNSYSLLHKTIGIHILNFVSLPEKQSYHNVFHITEKESKDPYFCDLELHTVELKKFTGTQSTAVGELLSKIKTSLDVWVAFLTRHDLLSDQKLPLIPEKKNLTKALHVLEVMNFNKTEREDYEAKKKWFLDELSILENAEKKGLEKGLEKGLIKGKTEIAKKLLKLGVDKKIILEATGFTEKELAKYRE